MDLHITHSSGIWENSEMCQNDKKITNHLKRKTTDRMPDHGTY